LVKTGIDILVRENFEHLKGERISLLCHQASVSSELKYTFDLICNSNNIQLASILGPQHGVFAETQANMVEWNSYIHPWLNIPVYPLYGREVKLKKEFLNGAETVVVDLQDIGARPYTYIWTTVLLLKECARLGLEVVILDRPNPIGGTEVEGPVLKEGFESLVGVFPLAMRHGLTFAEAIVMIKEKLGISSPLTIVKMEGWHREMMFDDTSLPWVQPSPNIPTPETTILYPGMVLLEGTNISEGRGTTRPFEIVGAPWIAPEKLAKELSILELDGVIFRPIQFIPAWDKYANTMCGGVQIHITNPQKFKPVRCGAIVIWKIKQLYPEHFSWLEPPYEYEDKIPPIDIISGSAELRENIDRGDDIKELFDRWNEEEEKFLEERKPFLIY